MPAHALCTGNSSGFWDSGTEHFLAPKCVINPMFLHQDNNFVEAHFAGNLAWYSWLQWGCIIPFVADAHVGMSYRGSGNTAFVDYRGRPS
jgi:hypothetical protein